MYLQCNDRSGKEKCQFSSIDVSHICGFRHSISFWIPVSDHRVALGQHPTTFFFCGEAIINNPNIGQRLLFGISHDHFLRFRGFFPEKQGKYIHGSTEDFNTTPPCKQSPAHFISVIHLARSARSTEILPQSTSRVDDVTSQHRTRNRSCGYIMKIFNKGLD